MTSTSHKDPITETAERLMQAVARSGAVKRGQEDFACQVMREELKAFIIGDKYADEREILKTGGHNLAWASLVTTCIQRISNAH